MRAVLPLLTLLLVAPVLAGCLSNDDPTPTTGDDLPALPPIPELDGAALVQEIQSFSETFPKRNANGPDHKAAREHLVKEMESAGLEVLRQTFTAAVSKTSTPTNIVTDDGTLENLIGIKWGRDNASWIVIGGHYDVTDAALNGAYDDGSGTILTLQTARAFADMETEKTIAFFMFDGEEQGLRGSSHFVKSLSEGTFADEFGHDPEIFAMINLDMFGINWPAAPPIYFDDNSEVIRRFVDESRRDIGIPDDKIRFTGISAGRSDYAPFEDACIPIAFFISAFEEYYAGPLAAPKGQTYPFWHRVDTIETMELMAGSRELLEQGFDTAGQLSTELLHFLATTPDLDVDVRYRPMDPCT